MFVFRKVNILFYNDVVFGQLGAFGQPNIIENVIQ